MWVLGRGRGGGGPCRSDLRSHSSPRVQFFGGLEAKIGAPDSNVLQAMEREHTAASDSTDDFTTTNYEVTTTPQKEWWFVAEPDRKGEEWPVEHTLRDTPDLMRLPMLLPDMRRRLDERNKQLGVMSEPLLMLVEAFGARLYTGPM